MWPVPTQWRCTNDVITVAASNTRGWRVAKATFMGSRQEDGPAQSAGWKRLHQGLALQYACVPDHPLWPGRTLRTPPQRRLHPEAPGASEQRSCRIHGNSASIQSQLLEGCMEVQSRTAYI